MSQKICGTHLHPERKRRAFPRLRSHSVADLQTRVHLERMHCARREVFGRRIFALRPRGGAKGEEEQEVVQADTVGAVEKLDGERLPRSEDAIGVEETGRGRRREVIRYDTRRGGRHGIARRVQEHERRMRDDCLQVGERHLPRVRELEIDELRLAVEQLRLQLVEGDREDGNRCANADLEREGAADGRLVRLRGRRLRVARRKRLGDGEEIAEAVRQRAEGEAS